jgi:hypothetical protein
MKQILINGRPTLVFIRDGVLVKIMPDGTLARVTATDRIDNQTDRPIILGGRSQWRNNQK